MSIIYERVRRGTVGKELNFTVKAAFSKKSRVKNMVLICVLGGIACVGVTFGVLSLMRGQWLYSVCYLIGVLLCFAIMVMKINTAFPPYVAITEKNLFLRTWDNHVVPYDINHKIGFISDFKPAKVIMQKMPIREIAQIVIGTKNYVKRNCNENEAFTKDIAEIEKQKRTAISGIDLFYAVSKDGNSLFMSIDKFDADEIAKLLKAISRKNGGTVILCNNRQIKRKIGDLPVKQSSKLT